MERKIEMKLQLLAPWLILLASFGAAFGQDDDAKKDLAKMQGNWQLVHGAGDGETASEYVIRNFKCVFKGDRLTFDGIAPLTNRAGRLTVKLDTSTTPRCIDLKVETGSLKGDILEGAYEWKGDELKLCVYLGKGNRPLDFEAKAGSDRVLFVLKKAEPP
jgi:uncharacterized protein (TIGR03067 family)